MNKLSVYIEKLKRVGPKGLYFIGLSIFSIAEMLNGEFIISMRIVGLGMILYAAITAV